MSRAKSSVDRIEEAIRAHYESYLAAFNARDAAAVATHYAAPCVFITEDGVMVLNSSAEIEALFSKMLTALERQNYGHSDVHDHDITVLSERLAQLSGRAVRYTKAGVEFERLGAVYTLRLADGAWKIVTAMAHPLSD